MTRTRDRSGFTLIELMVALVILSILMGFAIPEVIHQIEASKKETQKQNEKAINKAIQDYYADHGRYPSTLDDLRNATHPYFEEIPIDPMTGRADSWLITNKSNYLTTKMFFTKGDFVDNTKPPSDPDAEKATKRMAEGVYRVKAKR